MKVVLSMYQASRKEGNAILITTWDIVTVTILSYKWGNGDPERLVKLPDIMQPIWIEPEFTATWPHTECFWWRHFFIHCSETGRGRENTQIDSLIASLTVNPWLRLVPKSLTLCLKHSSLYFIHRHHSFTLPTTLLIFYRWKHKDRMPMLWKVGHCWSNPMCGNLG